MKEIRRAGRFVRRWAGLLLLGAGKGDEAKADFQKVLELAPADSAQAKTARTALDSIK